MATTSEGGILINRQEDYWKGTNALPTSFFGEFSWENPDCVPLAETTPGVRTFLLCFCIMCTCQALYQLYHTVPADDSIRARRASWDFVAVPLVEAFVYGLMSSNAAVGYVRLFDGRAVYWLRTVGWLLTVPVLLLQIGKMSKFRVRGLDVNNIIVWLGIFMVICGFSASLSSNDGLKWMFFILGLVSLLTIYVAAYFIMIAAGNFYVALDSEEGLLIAHRIRIMMFIFFFSWSLYPLFFLLSIEGACVVSENVTVVCFTLLDCLTKNIFGLVLWDTLWNRTLGGRWTSNAEAMAAEMDVLPLHEDAENSMNEGQMVPYADENGEKHVEADVVVRPGTPARRSIAGSKMRSPMPVPAAAHSMPASKIRSNAGGQSPYPVAPVEVLPPYFNSLGPNTGQNFVEADLDPLHTGLPVNMTGKSAYGADVQSPRMLPKQSSDFTGNPNGTDAYNSALMGHASVMRSRTSQTASEYALPDIYVPPGGAGRSGVRDNSMDDVVDHVRSLNQALTDLLSTDPTNGSRSSHAV